MRGAAQSSTNRDTNFMPLGLHTCEKTCTRRCHQHVMMLPPPNGKILLDFNCLLRHIESTAIPPSKNNIKPGKSQGNEAFHHTPQQFYR